MQTWASMPHSSPPTAGFDRNPALLGCCRAKSFNLMLNCSAPQQLKAALFIGSLYIKHSFYSLAAGPGSPSPSEGRDSNKVPKSAVPQTWHLLCSAKLNSKPYPSGLL